MSAYAIANMRDVKMGPEIVEYLEKIDDTLAPFEGRFVVHGAQPEVMEGSWPTVLVAIEFPDLERARQWYAYPAYQAILPLRAENSDSDLILIDGVPADHRATDVLA
ncbi:DUF1330 domain-containing protein [Sphaerisporangium fuscum]|uniref:DUF1330 domain-containing protein n=1 Tax=Sphaerisporangium fuscum TaxID=2835868 RepID=UPI001BDC3049|nr:DUF1330 domain-containing protein [Sphaerisporangium fuscum]